MLTPSYSPTENLHRIPSNKAAIYQAFWAVYKATKITADFLSAERYFLQRLYSG